VQHLYITNYDTTPKTPPQSPTSVLNHLWLTEL
jgi:hypothetical protein